MKTSKTLMLAAVAALSLGVGSAMADGNGGTFPDYQSQKLLQQRVMTPTSDVQSGSSDLLNQGGADHSASFILNHGLAGAGGVSG